MITSRGFRHLLFDGNTFGEFKVKTDTISWRCTANIPDQNKKCKRCNASLTTRMINGYEMIRSIAVRHSHPRKHKLGMDQPFLH